MRRAERVTLFFRARGFLAPAMALTFAVVCLAHSAQAEEADLRCGQEPGNRFFWVERGYCDLDMLGPDRAVGIVIWNHGISGTGPQYQVPPALMMRLLQVKGWDVIKINRNNLGETSVEASLRRAVGRTLDEVKAQRKRGYRRVVLAGQSFGGYISLEAAEAEKDLFGVVAMAPGVVLRGGGSFGLDGAVTDRLLQGIRAERLAVVFPAADSMFGSVERGRSAVKILRPRIGPWLLLDETSGISGHAGATGGRFSLRYGTCLVEFLSPDEVPGGRFSCPESKPWEATRELLGWPSSVKPVSESSIPSAIAALNGTWYGLLGESVVAFALVGGSEVDPGVLYRAATPRVSGGMFSPTVSGPEVHVRLPSKAEIIVTPGPGEAATLTWISADRTRTEKTTLKRVSPGDP